jgi:hypothetical protein
VPSLVVDVNSWTRLACYPRGSFYPVSYRPSTRRGRITKSAFRLCSGCPPRSQAGFCLCTLRLVSIQPEPTFERLRYLLGGDRPSQTAPLPLSPPFSRLGSKHGQAGISPSAPSTLARRLLRLPAILHRPSPNAMPGYSQAPRGLFVQLRVARIFTRTSISPGPWLRQCSTRYAFRAGRNLPDKEFRYLRTVIVTAAVHRGFNSELAPLLLTFRHWAGVSPYTSVFTFAETCVSGKQSIEPFHCNRFAPAPLLPKLRGLFAEFLNQGSPVRLSIFYSSTCVGFGYGWCASSSQRLFLMPGTAHFSACASASRAFPACHLPPTAGCASQPLSAASPRTSTGVFTGCPSPAPPGFGLGPTDPTRTDLPSEPFDFRRARFSRASRYSCQHSHSSPLQCRLPPHLPREDDALLPKLALARASVTGFSPVPFSAPARSTSELLRTLSRVAASKPTSWLLSQADSVSHLAGTSGP